MFLEITQSNKITYRISNGNKITKGVFNPTILNSRYLQITLNTSYLFYHSYLD